MNDPTSDFNDEILVINQQDLRSEYAQMAHTLKAWLDQAAAAADYKRTSKLKLTRVKKAVELSIRNSSGVKTTEKTIEAEVESHPLVISSGDELAHAELIEDRVNAVVDSLKTKRAMIMTLGGLVRTEMEADRFAG